MGAPQVTIETITVTRPLKVIAFTCCTITCILMTAATATADWVMAEGWREGLFSMCITALAPKPIPFLADEDDMVPGCVKARSASYIRGCAALVIIGLLLDIFGTFLTGLGLRSTDPNKKYKYYRVAIYTLIVAVVAFLLAAIIYPVQFSKDIGDEPPKDGTIVQPVNYQGSIDFDGDGTLDFFDTDDDNDGILDENDKDFDNDGVLNEEDDDDDNDGIPDEDEDGDEDGDTDDDGIPDDEDEDDDGDGVIDALDEDDDNDGLPDEFEEGVDPEDDVDGDGIPDEFDNDDDNDNIPDDEDTDDDGDNIPDEEDPDDNSDEDDEDNDNVDSDGDGTVDAEDLDDDNDGIPDTIDADDDGDGVNESPRVYSFGFGYGATWGSIVLIFASVVLLICDRESEEIFYKERQVDEEEEEEETGEA